MVNSKWWLRVINVERDRPARTVLNDYSPFTIAHSLPNHVPIRRVAALGADLVAVPGGELDLDAAVAAVEGRVGLVSYEVLRAQLVADLLEGAFERQHVAGEEGAAARLLREAAELLVARVLDRAGLDAGDGAPREAALGRDGEDDGVGLLRDLDGVVEARAAVGVVAVGDDDERAARARSRAHLLVAELPDGVVERGLRPRLLDVVDGLLKQVEVLGEVLAERDGVVEGDEGGLILARED